MEPKEVLERLRRIARDAEEAERDMDGRRMVTLTGYDVDAVLAAVKLQATVMELLNVPE